MVPCSERDVVEPVLTCPVRLMLDEVDGEATAPRAPRRKEDQSRRDLSS